MSDYQNGYQPGQGGYQNQPYQQPQPPIYSPPQYQPSVGMEPPAGYMQKSRKVAGLLAMLAGTFGLHCFYLGNTSSGLIRLLVASPITCGVGAIVTTILGVIDGVKILDGRNNTDSYGIYLKD